MNQRKQSPVTERTLWETDSLTKTHSPPRSPPLSLRRRKSPSAWRIQGHAVKQLERTQCVLLCSQTAANSQLDLKSAHKVVIYKSLMEIFSTALDGWQKYFSDVNINDVTYTIHKNYWSRFHNIYSHKSVARFRAFRFVSINFIIIWSG